MSFIVTDLVVHRGEYYFMNAKALSKNVRQYLRACGHTQKELAAEVGLHEKVLSRKLNRRDNAYLTQPELKKIINVLSEWQAITRSDEVTQLLQSAGFSPQIYIAEEWGEPPLCLLEQASHKAPSQSLTSRYTVSNSKHNLPMTLKRLIGRDDLLERLKELLKQERIRLVTLIGTAGSGKTFLSQHVARALVHDFPDGVWFVSLIGVDNPYLIPITIIQAMSLPHMPTLSSLSTLLQHIREKRLLLVLDNFEHVLEGAAQIHQLLGNAPGLKVLVTSRRVLGLPEEHEYTVPPLGTPPSEGSIALELLAQYPAIELFIERAREVVPDFRLTAENSSLLAQVCTRVDGLPLALELAAARTNQLPLADLHERLLQSRLKELTRGETYLPLKHRALRATIDWSYNLLSHMERYCFSLLGIFHGSWSLEAAEMLLHDMLQLRRNEAASQSSLNAVAILLRLTDNSLIARLPDSANQVRFSMLETLREYALEQLEMERLDRLVRDWQACYYVRLAEEASYGLRGPDQLQWFAQLTADRENFRAALSWLVQQAKMNACIGYPALQGLKGNADSEGHSVRVEPMQDVSAIELALRLAAALRLYWEWQGSFNEACYWLETILALPFEELQENISLLAARAHALDALALFMHFRGDRIRAEALEDTSIALWQRLGNPDGMANALFHRGWLAHVQGNLEHSKDLFDRSLGLLTEDSDPWLRAKLYYHLGQVAGFAGDHTQAKMLVARSRELFEYVGDKKEHTDALNAQGGMAILANNYAEAVPYLLQGMTRSYELGYRKTLAEAIGILGFLVGLKGEPDGQTSSIYAAQIMGAAEVLFEELGVSTWLLTQPLVTLGLQLMTVRVGEANWNEAWADGRRRTVDETMQLISRLFADMLVERSSAL